MNAYRRTENGCKVNQIAQALEFSKLIILIKQLK
jgi:hypothetical protein